MEKVLLLHCAESGKKALQRMIQLGHKLPGNIQTFELPCTGRVNDVLLMETLQDGFDGVLVIGCQYRNPDPNNILRLFGLLEEEFA
jgi:coenzyme F420-reducing hydrogenase delta subunit